LPSAISRILCTAFPLREPNMRETEYYLAIGFQ